MILKGFNGDLQASTSLVLWMGADPEFSTPILQTIRLLLNMKWSGRIIFPNSLLTKILTLFQFLSSWRQSWPPFSVVIQPGTRGPANVQENCREQQVHSDSLQVIIYLSFMRVSHSEHRFPLNVGYSEGWGLYSESLGYELGFYEDPLVRFGHLGAEMFRACRLVVDTGIHALGWDMERAVKYMVDNNPSFGETMIRQTNRIP